MKRAGIEIRKLLNSMGENSESARLNMRIQQVRQRYKQAIQRAYDPRTARYHLAHTNNVIIREMDGVKSLVVFVDDSACAADLNAQRELVTLYLLELFGEEIDRFDIRISKWKRYRENHPYLEEEGAKREERFVPVPLDEKETAFVSETASKVSDKKVRKALEKAMTAVLEWKKGEKVEKEG